MGERQISDDDFDRILVELMDAETPRSLLCIAGIYEILSEHFNNAILEQWDKEQELYAED